MQQKQTERPSQWARKVCWFLFKFKLATSNGILQHQPNSHPYTYFLASLAAWVLCLCTSEPSPGTLLAWNASLSPARGHRKDYKTFPLQRKGLSIHTTPQALIIITKVLYQLRTKSHSRSGAISFRNVIALLLVKISQHRIKPSPRIIRLDINEALFQFPDFSHSLFKHWRHWKQFSHRCCVRIKLSAQCKAACGLQNQSLLVLDHF